MGKQGKANHAYFQGCTGSWACRTSAEVTNFKALRRAVGLMNAISLKLMSVWPGFLGGPRLLTTVEYDGTDTVVHTTVIQWLWLPMVRSREVLTLDADGTHMLLRSDARFLMAPWRRERAEGAGDIDDTTTIATYNWQVMGTDMVQTTLREPDRVTLTQNMPGYRAVQPLDRVGS